MLPESARNHMPDTIDLDDIDFGNGWEGVGTGTHVGNSVYRALAVRRPGGPLVVMEVRVTPDETSERAGLNEFFGYRVSKLELD